MAINFSQIPANLRVNKIAIELSNELAQQGNALMPVKPLIIGQQLSTGALTANVITKVTNSDSVARSAGYGSMLHLMAKAFFKNNKFSELYICPVDDAGGGVKATSTLTVTATNALSGTISLYVGGQLTQITVNKDDAQNTIADSINTAINANKNLPVTSTVATNVVTISAKNKGTLGNKIDVRLNYYDDESLPSGVSIATIAMASGATDPTLSTTLDAIPQIWYNYIAFPYSDSTSLTALKTWLDERSEAMIMLDSMTFIAKNDTYANLGTLGDSINNEWVSIIDNYKAPSTDFEKCAAVMGLASFYCNTSVGSRVVPLQQREIKGILPAKEADRFTEIERNTLLYDGISTSVTYGDVEKIDQLITTYKENDSGGDDWSYLYVETLEGLRFLRFDMRSYLASKYPNKVIGEEGVKYEAGNKDVLTLSSLKNDLIGRAYSYWLKNNLIVDPDDFKASLVAEINETNPNRADMMLVPTISKGLRQIAGKIAFK